MHRRAWEAIPWLVNGRIGDAERDQLEAHLLDCRDCRDELALQRQLRDEIRREAEPAPDAQALERLWQRIDSSAAMDGVPPAAARPRPWVRWLAAAAVIETVALAAVVGANFGAAPEYRTYSSAAAAPGSGTIRAVFEANLPLGDLQQLLDRANLRIVDGPTDLGVYTLAPRADAPRDAALTLLRADARVRFAEPAADARAPQ